MRERTRAFLATLASVACPQRLDRIVEMLELFDQRAILVDRKQNGARLPTLGQVERSALPTEPLQDPCHLCP
jgi:hypothetical protein